MYTEFRGPGEWEGEYDDVGKVVAKLDVGQDLQYHLVISKQPDEVDGDYVDVFFLIPVTWIDWEGKRFLYPGPDYQVHGLPPWEWRDLSYRRRRHPESSWVEYDIAEFINESPVSFNEAQEESNNLEKSIRNGELQNSKIRRKQVTADSHLGFSKDNSFQADPETFSPNRLVGSSLLKPSASYVGQRPGFCPSAHSSPQSVKSYTPLRDAAMPLNDSSTGLPYTPRRDTAISLNDLSTELQETSRFSSERDIRSSNRGGFHKLMPSSRIRRVSKGSGGSGLYASTPSLPHIDESADPLNGSGSSFTNSSFRPNPLSAKKSVNSATNVAGSGRRDAHPERRDALPNRKDTHPARKDSHPAKKDTNPGRTDTSPEGNIPAKRGTNRAEVDADPHQEEADPEQTGGPPSGQEIVSNKDGNSTSSFQGIVINFCSSALKLLKDLVDPKLTKERVINDNYEHFRTVVSDNLSLPLTDPENVPVLNNALLDMRLSVSLCCLQIRALRSLNSKDKIAKELMRRLFSDGLCRQITWKERRADRRQAYGHLVNVVAVICVVIQHILELNKMEPVQLTGLISTIQNARRLIATAHKQTGAPVTAATNEDGDGATACDRHLILQFDSRISEINTAISNYVP